ncbi:PIG-L deacetylase family protein [Chitinilyticum piscinae]|uniref:PIG-L family deacetylase n=1 Tax=Chitinilyticum piscinae TaxID=2866724 RepID=A0A8J7G234_9NEIS|nr:PIG-L family deacetylase [Chitinilyticum piscinae]MBE9609968.1 PIG-L family deacetylase [Chitinilyticum piscinae]
MANPYLALVETHAALLQKTDAPLFADLSSLSPAKDNAAADAPVVVIFAPHPDDECIIGALPLRLQREAGFRVVNVAVTQGSNVPRKAERWAELKNACDYLAWGLRETIPGGLEAVTCKTRDGDAAAWAEKVDVIVKLLNELKPAVVVCPNDNDGHAAHIGTHYLVVDALKKAGHACQLVQSEFWRAMATPNTLIGSNSVDTADLIAALACHVGEVKRNPYHLRLTSWMADNVRRGAEVVGGAGVAAPTFSFGTIYRIDRFDGQQIAATDKKYVLSENDDIRAVLS